jgi:hypothetical protein
MRLPCKTKIEKAWLVTSLCILFIYKTLEASPPDYSSPAIILRWWLEVAMVLLSFPLGGLVMFVLRDATFWCDGCGNLEWMLDWSTLLLAGYIQWFWVLPGFLRDRQLTVLNLRQHVEAVLPDASTASAPEVPQLAATTTATTAAESLPFPPAEFDTAGLTALGRVLQAEIPQPVRVPPAPRAELIFPQV